MADDTQNRSEASEVRESYERPEICELGTVKDLTKGNHWFGTTDYVSGAWTWPVTVREPQR
jgi:hypothetical protein